MNANMKVSQQCRLAVFKGNQVLGMIRRNITYKENSLIVPLYNAIVRSHLEYCTQAWSPYLRKDIDMFEKYRGAPPYDLYDNSGLTGSWRPSGELSH